jgi:hypothetical protein
MFVLLMAGIRKAHNGRPNGPPTASDGPLHGQWRSIECTRFVPSSQYVLEIFLTRYAHEKISSHPRPPGGATGRARLAHGRAIDSADDNPARSGHRAGHRASRSYFLPPIHSAPGFTVRRARRRLRPRHNRQRAAKFSIATVTNPAYAFIIADSGVTLKGRRRLSDNPRCRLTEE